MSDSSNTSAPPADTATAPAQDETSNAESGNIPKSTASTPPSRGYRAQIQTVRLDSRDFQASWPMAIATLEKLSGWSVLALRLGTLALIQQCVRELAEEDVNADVVVRLRALTDALAHMPLET